MLCIANQKKKREKRGRLLRATATKSEGGEPKKCLSPVTKRKGKEEGEIFKKKTEAGCGNHI